MKARTKIDDLPEFNAATYLKCKTEKGSYLSDIIAADDADLLAMALSNIERASLTQHLP